jgi:glycosyltransferase involved in cell wall biosynthesis
MRKVEAPIVSVILTVFRRTHFLEQAIECVLSQTYTSWECIISDDADTLAAREVCARFSNDPRIRYRRNKTTLGTPLNVAAALSECRGDYVVIFNDDDLLYPEMLERLIGPLRANPVVVMAFGERDTIDVNGERLEEECDADAGSRPDSKTSVGMVDDAFEFAVRRGVMVVMGCMIRRGAIDTSWLVSEVAGAYDYWLAINLGRCGGFWKIEDKVMAWRQHENSVSSTPSRNNYRAEIYIYERLRSESHAGDLGEYVKTSLARVLFLRGWEHLSYGWDVGEARRLLFRSLAARGSFRTAGYLGLSFCPSGVRKLALGSCRAVRKDGGAQMR